MADSTEEVKDFGWALEKLRSGSKVYRLGWNGKGMFAFLVNGSKFTVNREPLISMFPEGTEINYRPHLDLKATDGTIGVWTPSTTDLLAKDWEEEGEK